VVLKVVLPVETTPPTPVNAPYTLKVLTLVLLKAVPAVLVGVAPGITPLAAVALASELNWVKPKAPRKGPWW